MLPNSKELMALNFRKCLTRHSADDGAKRPGRKGSWVSNPYYYHFGSCAGGNGRLINDEAGARMGWKRPWPVGAAYRGVRRPGRKSSRVCNPCYPCYCYGSCAGGDGRLTNNEAGA